MSKRSLILIVAFALCAFLIATLAACGAASTTSTNPSGSGTTASTLSTSTSVSTPTSGSTSTTGAGQGGITYSTGANTLVLQVNTAGGLIPPGLRLSELPEFSLYGDGRVIETGPIIEIYPPAALPNLQTTTVSGEVIQAMLAAAQKAGLFANGVDYGNPGVTDMPSTTIVINANGTTYKTVAYALGFDSSANGGAVSGHVTPEQSKARALVNEFRGRLVTLQGFVQAEPRFEPYQFTAIAVFTRNADGYKTDPSGVEPNRLTWPLADLANAGTEVNGGYRKLVVSGKDLDTLMPLLKQATTITLWQSGGHQYQLVLRPLLPDQTS
jgi:hypothetical protein